MKIGMKNTTKMKNKRMENKMYNAALLLIFLFIFSSTIVKADTLIINYDVIEDIYIKVISPNGGDNWTIGTTSTIKWSSSDSTGRFVKIELLKGGELDRIISHNTFNDGSHDWNIPVRQTIGSDYKIRITSTSNFSYTDMSDNNFTIIDQQPSYITIKSPNGGETWKRSTIHPIRWNSVGNPKSYVNIELFKGDKLDRVISQNTPNDGSYNWIILYNQTTGDDFKVKITSASNSAYYDWSDNYFDVY